MTRRDLVALLAVLDRLPVCALRFELEALVLAALANLHVDDSGMSVAANSLASERFGKN